LSSYSTYPHIFHPSSFSLPPPPTHIYPLSLHDALPISSPATSPTTRSTPVATASGCWPTASSPTPSRAPCSGAGSAPTSTSTCTWPSAPPCPWPTTSCPTCCARDPSAPPPCGTTDHRRRGAS